MKYFLAMIFVLLCYTTMLFSQADWEWQYSTTTADLNDVYFVDYNTGWGRK